MNPTRLVEEPSNLALFNTPTPINTPYQHENRDSLLLMSPSSAATPNTEYSMAPPSKVTALIVGNRELVSKAYMATSIEYARVSLAREHADAPAALDEFLAGMQRAEQTSPLPKLSRRNYTSWIKAFEFQAVTSNTAWVFEPQSLLLALRETTCYNLLTNLWIRRLAASLAIEDVAQLEHPLDALRLASTHFEDKRLATTRELAKYMPARIHNALTMRHFLADFKQFMRLGQQSLGLPDDHPFWTQVLLVEMQQVFLERIIEWADLAKLDVLAETKPPYRKNTLPRRGGKDQPARGEVKRDANASQAPPRPQPQHAPTPKPTPLKPSNTKPPAVHTVENPTGEAKEDPYAADFDTAADVHIANAKDLFS
ncbi:hypothetical protein KEM52_006222 [Ascosphaera acerosa]|nr:hypothetical protein KEM52_006222 [Ascosphaera acerosa]